MRYSHQNRDTFFLVHVEDQSTPQADFNKRMFRYSARLLEKHDLPVYPIVVFSYDRPLRVEPHQYKVIFPDLRVLDYRYRVIQLNRLNWRKFVHQPNPVASALMAKMRIAVKDRPKVKLECLRLLATLHLDRAKMQLISGFVDSYLALNTAEQRIFDKEMAAISPPQKEVVMEIMTSWKREGLQQGEAEIIVRMLRRRFGDVSAALQKSIQGLSTEQLERLAEELLDFSQLSDLQAWLADNA